MSMFLRPFLGDWVACTISNYFFFLKHLYITSTTSRFHKGIFVVRVISHKTTFFTAQYARLKIQRSTMPTTNPIEFSKLKLHSFQHDNHVNVKQSFIHGGSPSTCPFVYLAFHVHSLTFIFTHPLLSIVLHIDNINFLLYSWYIHIHTYIHIHVANK